jgi:hypothetical protein
VEHTTGGGRVEDDEKAGLFGLALGIGLGLWATIGDGGIGVGVFAVLVIVASLAWLSTSMI